MADFVAVIRRTVDGLSDNSPDMRAKVYEKARGAVRRQLEGMKPRPSDDMIDRQMAKLEAAIGEVESAHAAPEEPDVFDDTPAATDFEQPPVPYDVSSAEQHDLPATTHAPVPEADTEPHEEPHAEPAPRELPPAPVILPVAVAPEPVAPEASEPQGWDEPPAWAETPAEDEPAQNGWPEVEAVEDRSATAPYDDRASGASAEEHPPVEAYDPIVAPTPHGDETYWEEPRQEESPEEELREEEFREVRPHETASNAALAAGTVAVPVALAAHDPNDEPARDTDAPSPMVYEDQSADNPVDPAPTPVEAEVYDENDAEALPAEEDDHWAREEPTPSPAFDHADPVADAEPVAAMPSASYDLDDHIRAPVSQPVDVPIARDEPAAMPSAEWELPEWQDSAPGDSRAVEPHPVVTAHVEQPWTQPVDEDAILDEFEALAGSGVTATPIVAPPAADAIDARSHEPVSPVEIDPQDLPPVSGGVTPDGEPASSWSLDEADPFHQPTREAGDASADSAISDWSWPVDRSAVTSAPVEETEDSRRESWDEIDALLGAGAAGTAAGAAAGAYESSAASAEPAPMARPASYRAEPKKSAFSVKRILTTVVLLLLLGGGGYAYWMNRDTMNGWIAELVASVNTPPPQQTVNGTNSDGTSTTAASGGSTTPATEVASATPSNKFTQRLQPDGTEVDEGPAQVAGSAPQNEEGKSVAAQTEASRPAETADAGATAAPEATTTDAPAADAGATPPVTTAPAADTTAQTAPPDQTTTQMPAGAQKMFLYEERLGQTAPTAIEGGVAWSLKEEAPSEGQRPEPVIQAQISVPDRGLTALMTIKRNADSSLPASHTIEFVFSLPENFEGGSIDSVQRVAMKRTEQDRGDPLIAVPAKITDDFYMIALNDFPEAVTTNLDLLRTRNWIDIPLTYRNGRRALLTLEKGPAGSDAFDKALASWGTARPAGQ